MNAPMRALLHSMCRAISTRSAWRDFMRCVWEKATETSHKVPAATPAGQTQATSVPPRPRIRAAARLPGRATLLPARVPGLPHREHSRADRPALRTGQQATVQRRIQHLLRPPVNYEQHSREAGSSPAPLSLPSLSAVRPPVCHSHASEARCNDWAGFAVRRVLVPRVPTPAQACWYANWLRRNQHSTRRLGAAPTPRLRQLSLVLRAVATTAPLSVRRRPARLLERIGSTPRPH